MAVVPFAPILPVWIAETVWIARLTKRRCSFVEDLRLGNFSVRSGIASSWPLAWAVTASAMALSRQRLRVRNSSTVMSAFRSKANSVMAWQTSP